jgi:galactokinase
VVSGVAERLADAGLLPAEARRKKELFEAVDAALADLRAGAAADEEVRFFVPGRIEVLGKHTDYAGGRSLLATVGRGFCVAASPRTDSVLRVADAGRGLRAEVPLSSDLVPSAGNWVIYAETVAARLARNFPGPLRGADVALASDLPRASGLSSSSALVVALFSVLSEGNALRKRAEWGADIRTAEDLAEYLGALENGRTFGSLSGDRGVGTRGGSEDHAAILCGRAGELRQYAFCPVRFERSVRFEEDWTFVVASSGVASDKTGEAREKYNRLSLAAAAVLDLWNGSTGRSDPSLFAAATGVPDAPERIRRLLGALPNPDYPPGFLLGRFEQFIEESIVLVPAVGDLLEKGEPRLIGELVDRSQELAERNLGNQTPETIHLAREARSLGAAAASAFGGGFGGSVWAIVEAAEADGFRRRWAEGYARAFPAAARDSRFFATRPGPAVIRL